ncbi:hypothetical protein C0Q70_17304 [Pomacea canaliculata]|uniref:CUB domain-containing protein n=1 Tax=Pomacea canaliculata TaxID=400727 RepID=A0A2T7NK21_POMCA|nr:hypothetical protein C0Q70_17304 [Pomacea canaliculata]
MLRRLSSSTASPGPGGSAMLLQTDPVAANGAAQPMPCKSRVMSDNAILSLPAGLLAGNECYFLLTRNASDANVTTLLFSSLAMQGNDYLLLYDGNVSGVLNPADIVANMSGTREPFLAVFSSNVSTVMVHITSNDSRSNFTAMLSLHGCEQDQSLTPGNLVLLLSPEYSPSQGSFQCKYKVSMNGSATDSKLALSFRNFNLPGATLNVTTDLNATQELTGANHPADVYADTSIELVLSIKGSVNSSQDFIAFVSVISKACQGVKTVNGSGYINFTVPELHPYQQDCRVTVKAASGKSLLLNVTTLQLSQGDALNVFDGASVTGRQLAVFQTPSQPYILVSTGQDLLVRLIVDDSPGIRNVVIKITEQVEGGLYSNSNFTLQYPGSNTTQYYLLKTSSQEEMLQILLESKPENGTYAIIVYNRCTNNVLVTFSPKNLPFPLAVACTEVLLEATWFESRQNFTASVSDTIKAALGSYTITSTPDLPPLCRLTIIPQVKGLPVTEVMLPLCSLVFSGYTSSNLSTTLVSVYYQVVNSVCGGVLPLPSGRMTSPRFPNQYPLNVDCTWILPNTSANTSVLFHVENFSLAQNHSLVILSEGGEARSNFTVEHQPTEDLLYTRAGSDSITFSSARQNNLIGENQVSQGFALDFWILECGRNLVAKSSEFSTPGFPDKKINTSLCVWRIQLPPTENGIVNIVNLTLTIVASSEVKV